MKILNIIRFILLAIILQSCTVIVTEKNIIMHDDMLSILSQADIANIKNMKNSIDVSKLSLKRSDGTTAKGLWIRQQHSNAVIIYFSGNAVRISKDYSKLLPELLSLNTDIVWLDHRGTGSSEGIPNMKNLFSDGLETFDYVKANSDKKIIIHGMSLGSFIAGNIATNKKINALIIEGSATTTNDWIDELIPWYAKLVSSITIDDNIKSAGNEQVVKQYSGPLFILVGEEDKVTPANLNQKLYDLSVSENKHIFIAKQLQHGNAITSSAAKKAIRQFIKSLKKV